VLLTKYYSGDEIKNNETGGTCGRFGERRGSYRVLVAIPEGKNPFGRPKNRYKDNILTVLKKLFGKAWLWIVTSGELCERGN
jgi:hypothetical protein